MLKLTSGSLIFAILVVGCAPAVPPAPAQQAPEVSTHGCTQPRFSLQSLTQAADLIQAAQGERTDATGYPELEGSGVALRSAGECVTVTAVGWDGELAGGLLFTGPSGRVLRTEPGYRGARGLRLADGDRLILTYTAAKGSGLYESRHVVLCHLGMNVWVECLETVARKVDIVSGLPSDDSLGIGMMMEQVAEIAIRGDTAIVTRSARVQHYGDAEPRSLDLGIVYLLLPK